MGLFDIIGPVMVGPSSSHTAGAARIGYICSKMMDERISEARILFYGSFLATGKGHGTDKALVAGLLGMKPDDERIPYSLEIAREQEMQVLFGAVELTEAHPNTVKLILTGRSGRKLEMVAASTGGGRIRICQIDGLDANFCGDYPTLIIHNLDQPGSVMEVTAMLAKEQVNIATMQLYRNRRGGNAVMILECDQEISKEFLEWIKRLEGILKVTYLSLREG